MTIAGLRSADRSITARLAQLYRTGTSIPRLAAVFDGTEHEVKRRLRAAGIKGIAKKPAGHSEHTLRRAARAHALRQSGLPFKAIAADLRTSISNAQKLEKIGKENL